MYVLCCSEAAIQYWIFRASLQHNTIDKEDALISEIALYIRMYLGQETVSSLQRRPCLSKGKVKCTYVKFPDIFSTKFDA